MQEITEESPMLVGQTGPLSGHRWNLSQKTIIGRDTTCDIVISDRQVSRQHATITQKNNGIFLEDLNSKNGTHINGTLISNEILLHDGDVIQVAFAQEFVFVSADSTMPLEIELNQVPQKTNKLLRLHKRSRRVWIGDTEVVPPLSVAQFRLLEMLYNHEGKVISRNSLAVEIWGDDGALEISNQALDALIRRLRDRLASINPNHNIIVTVRGHGLLLENPEINI